MEYSKKYKKWLAGIEGLLFGLGRYSELPDNYENNFAEWYMQGIRRMT